MLYAVFPNPTSRSFDRSLFMRVATLWCIFVGVFVQNELAVGQAPPAGPPPGEQPQGNVGIVFNAKLHCSSNPSDGGAKVREQNNQLYRLYCHHSGERNPGNTQYHLFGQGISEFSFVKTPHSFCVEGDNIDEDKCSAVLDPDNANHVSLTWSTEAEASVGYKFDNTAYSRGDIESKVLIYTGASNLVRVKARVELCGIEKSDAEIAIINSSIQTEAIGSVFLGVDWNGGEDFNDEIGFNLLARADELFGLNGNGKCVPKEGSLELPAPFGFQGSFYLRVNTRAMAKATSTATEERDGLSSSIKIGTTITVSEITFY